MTTGLMRTFSLACLGLATTGLVAISLAPAIGHAQATTPLPLSSLTLNPPASSGTAKAGTTAKTGTASSSSSSSGGKMKSCDQFGPGFVLQPGTDTCVRMGMTLRLDAGTGRTLGNAPNPGNNNTDMGTSSASSSDAWKNAR
ncbi:porin [Aquabacter sp. L1I39]|uniref:porin n=1 Tax=Aquabacter sp. L1I39 TaxID=2820278 RepID=UPI001ADC7A2E|nr:porin [Aquabacter sp. L1I39]QTL05764.1 porin [Aquabacter sp. L1I39]